MSFLSRTYTCGDAGSVRKLINLVAPWIDVSLPGNGIPDGSLSLLSDVCTDPNNGDKVFVVGEGYCSTTASNWFGVAFSSNGGLLWQVPLGNYQNLVNNPACYYKWNKVFAVDSNTIYICGIVDTITRKGVVAKSIDGGTTFNVCSPLPALVDDMDCNSIHFIDSLTGVVGMDDYVLKTTDGGASWIVLNGATSFTASGFPVGPVWGVHLSTAQNNVLALGSSTIAKAIQIPPGPGGILAGSWASAITVNNAGLRHLTTFDDSYVFASGFFDTVLGTIDGGSSWTSTYSLPGGLPTSGPSREASHFYKINVGTPEGFYSGNNNIYNTLNGVVVSPLPPLSETAPYLIKSVFTFYTESPPTPCYLLTECSTGSTILTNSDLSAAVGHVVQLSGIEGCYTVTVSQNCSGSIPVTVTQAFEDCVSCYPDCYLLTDCQEEFDPLIISTNMSAYLGQVVALQGYPGVCWSVSKSSTCEGSQVLPSPVTASFANCVSCLQKCYRLIDCTGENPDIITNSNLVAYVGQVIKILTCPDVCWQVLNSDTCENAVSVIITTYYTTCNQCLNIIKAPVVLKSRSVLPNYGAPHGTCSIEYIERVDCNFSESVYKKILQKRYGLKSCEEIDDYTNWWVKKQLLSLDLIKDAQQCALPECCSPCALSTNIQIFYPVTCPGVTDLVTEIVLSPSCDAVQNLQSEIVFDNS